MVTIIAIKMVLSNTNEPTNNYIVTLMDDNNHIQLEQIVTTELMYNLHYTLGNKVTRLSIQSNGNLIELQPDLSIIVYESLEAMKEVFHNIDQDTESKHCAADNILCNIVSYIEGGKEIVAIYNEIEKYYC